MGVEDILLLIVAVITFALSIFIYIKNRKNEVNISFGLFTLCGAVWAFNIAMFRTSTEIETAWFWNRMIYIFGTIFASSFLYFSEIFPFRKRILSTIRKLLIFSPFIIFLFFLLLTNLFIEDINITPKGNEVKLGLAYTGWILWFFVFMGLSFINLTSKYRESTGISRVQIRYVLLALLFPATASIPFNLILPYFGNYRLIWIGPFCVGAMVIVIAYAIIQYRLMDIRFVLGRGAVYVFSFIAVVSFASALMYLNARLTQPLPFNISGAIIIILSVLLFQGVFRFFEKFASKYFYYTFYSYQKVLTDLGKQLTQFLDLDKLSSLIISTLMNTMKLERTVVLLREPGDGEYRIQKNIGFKEENGISLVKDNFLTLWLESNQKPLVYEEISLIIRDTTDKKEKKGLETLKENMKRIEAAFCLPLLIGGKIIGMIVLGSKVSGDAFSEQDIDLLTNLSNQASIALQNAKLYSEVQGFSKKLEKEVEKATTELKEAYEELKTLDRAKSEFISIASHQLRTPLTAIKGYISMMLEKTYGNPPEKMEKPLKNIYISNERLLKLVNDLLNISRIEAGKIEMKFEKTAIEEIITSIIEELKNVVNEKGIYLKFEKPEKPLPKILIDKDKIRQVIMNIIDNGIHYTTHGGVTIKLKHSCLPAGRENSLKISVKDTGEGMTKEEISRLFESFSRGEAGTRFWTEGMGLGLYVAKKFINLHNGKIWAESPGKEKGSTFYIELPMK